MSVVPEPEEEERVGVFGFEEVEEPSEEVHVPAVEEVIITEATEEHAPEESDSDEPGFVKITSADPRAAARAAAILKQVRLSIPFFLYTLSLH